MNNLSESNLLTLCQALHLLLAFLHFYLLFLLLPASPSFFAPVCLTLYPSLPPNPSLSSPSSFSFPCKACSASLTSFPSPRHPPALLHALLASAFPPRAFASAVPSARAPSSPSVTSYPSSFISVFSRTLPSPLPQAPFDELSFSAVLSCSV